MVEVLAASPMLRFVSLLGNGGVVVNTAAFNLNSFHYEIVVLQSINAAL